MSSELVFITGASGHIGFQVLLDALRKGYRTRLAVRSDAKKDVILSNPVFKALNAADRVEFVIVKDLTTPNAYDDAVKDVDYIIHVASPLLDGAEKSQEEYHQYFIQPAVQGTIGILESAVKYGKSVKRVVITSSVVAIMSVSDLVSQDPSRVFNAESRAPDDNGPYGNEFHAYASSKIAALNASERFMKENKPSFDLVNIHPSYVEGRDDLIQSADKIFSGTNAMILGAAVGKKPDTPTHGATVFVGDVARLHVDSLNTSKIPAGSYMADYTIPNQVTGTVWKDLYDIVNQSFPEAVKSGLLKPVADLETITTYVDNSKTIKTFGVPFADFETQVKSVVGHFVELSAAA